MFAITNTKNSFVLTNEDFGGCGSDSKEIRLFATREEAKRAYQFFCDGGYWKESDFEVIEV